MSPLVDKEGTEYCQEVLPLRGSLKEPELLFILLLFNLKIVVNLLASTSLYKFGPDHALSWGVWPSDVKVLVIT